MFDPKMAQKCHFFGHKKCFLGSGGQCDAPSPYFAGDQLKRHVLQGWERLKKWPFLLKNGLKMPTSGQKQCFLGLGGQFDALLTLFSRCSNENNMCCRVEEPENG